MWHSLLWRSNRKKPEAERTKRFNIYHNTKELLLCARLLLVIVINFPEIFGGFVLVVILTIFMLSSWDFGLLHLVAVGRFGFVSFFFYAIYCYKVWILNTIKLIWKCLVKFVSLQREKTVHLMRIQQIPIYLSPSSPPLAIVMFFFLPRSVHDIETSDHQITYAIGVVRAMQNRNNIGSKAREKEKKIERKK